MTFNSNGQNPLDLFVNLPEEGFVSTFCRQMGQIFLVASMCREECRHSEQKRWPCSSFVSIFGCKKGDMGGEVGTYHSA